MTAEMKKPAPLTRAEKTVRIVFWLSLIAAFAVISSCVLLLECFHDEERWEQGIGSDGTSRITIPILFFSIVAAIAAIIIWLVVLVLVRLFGKSELLIGRNPAPPEITPAPAETTDCPSSRNTMKESDLTE